jgi:ribosomal protein L37AE/L43A
MIPNSLKSRKQAACDHNLWIRVPHRAGMWECHDCGKRITSEKSPNVAYRKIARYELGPDEQKIVDEMMK